jgi:hypothetical protein
VTRLLLIHWFYAFNDFIIRSVKMYAFFSKVPYDMFHSIFLQFYFSPVWPDHLLPTLKSDSHVLAQKHNLIKRFFKKDRFQNNQNEQNDHTFQSNE